LTDSCRKINTQKKFLLSAVVTVQTPCTAVWSVNDSSIDLVSSAFTPFKAFITTGSPKVMNLVIG